MKKITLIMFLWASMLLVLHSQTFSDKKTYTFDVNDLELLRVHNKYGDVQVKGISGNKAKLIVKRTIKSSSNKRLIDAKQDIYLDSTYSNGALIFFIQHPDYRLEISEDGRAHYTSKYQNWNQRKVHYKQKVETSIELQVPKNTPLYVSTHHKELTVQDINADVLAQNHHGSITLQAIGGDVQAYTHHGKIIASMTKAPTKDAFFDTHHGNIEVTYPSSLAADISMKTRHGDFFTDFDYQAVAMPVSLTKGKKGTKYKVEGGTSIRIGNGGPKLNFETYHGSIYILK